MKIRKRREKVKITLVKKRMKMKTRRNRCPLFDNIAALFQAEIRQHRLLKGENLEWRF
jgi:hypothetical protein